MAGKNVNKAWHTGRYRTAVEGSFRPNGSSALTASQNTGRGYSVARTSTGLFTITFDNFYNELDDVLLGLRVANTIPTLVQAGDWSASGKTLQVRVLQAAENKGIIPLPLGAFQEQDGTTLADVGAGPTPGWSAGDESGGIQWQTHANPDPVSTQFVWPNDVSPSTDVTLHVLAAKSGATGADAVTWLVECFNNIDGAAFDADTDYGGTSSAMTGAATAKDCQDETLVLANANTPATFPTVSTLTIQPTDGTLGTDNVTIVGAWLEYTRDGYQQFVLTDLATDVDAVVNFRALFRNSSVDA